MSSFCSSFCKANNTVSKRNRVTRIFQKVGGKGVVVAKLNTFSQYKEEIPTLISR